MTNKLWAMGHGFLKQEVITFLWDFLSHWQVYAPGAAVACLVGAGEFLSRKSFSKWACVATFVIAFSVAGFVMAWHQQFKQAEPSKAVLRSSQMRRARQ
jgi:hypothetical protein